MDQYGNFNLGLPNQPSVTTAQSSYQLNVPELNITQPLAALAAGSPIQIIQSNNAVVLIGAAALVAAVWFATKK